MSQTRTASATYTTTDVENVVRRVKADLTMIADSTGAWTSAEAANYAHDIEILAKAGYLAWVDLTLLQYGIEKKASMSTPMPAVLPLAARAACSGPACRVQRCGS